MVKGQPRIYQRAGTQNWSIEFQDENGNRVRESAKTADPLTATKLLERRLREASERAALPILKTPVDQGFELFMKSKRLKPTSFARYETSLAHWLHFFHVLEIDDFSHVTKKVIGQFIDWRKTVGVMRPHVVIDPITKLRVKINRRMDVTEATIRRDLAFLSSVWSLLVEHHDWEDEMKPCPISKGQKRGLKESRKRVRFASPEEWKAIMDATTGDYQRRILTLAVETGLREAEICNLLWSQVDLSRRQIVLLPDVVDTKNSEPRVIPLTGKAIEALSGTVLHSQTQNVFWHEFRDREGNIEIRRFQRMSNWWKATRRRSGVQNFKFHDIRHTYASNFVNDGGDIAVLKEILGHSSLQVTERYAHMIAARLHEEVRRIDEKKIR